MYSIPVPTLVNGKIRLRTRSQNFAFTTSILTDGMCLYVCATVIQLYLVYNSYISIALVSYITIVLCILFCALYYIVLFLQHLDTLPVVYQYMTSQPLYYTLYYILLPLLGMCGGPVVTRRSLLYPEQKEILDETVGKTGSVHAQKPSIAAEYLPKNHYKVDPRYIYGMIDGIVPLSFPQVELRGNASFIEAKDIQS